MTLLQAKYNIVAILLAVLLFISTTLYVIADDINNQVAVGNAAPAASGVTVNGGSNVTLTEDTTTWATTTVTASDANGCNTITLVSIDMFRSGVGSSSCDTIGEADDNYCYSRTTCTATTTGNTCTGGSDTSVEYDCPIELQYYTDATGVGGGYEAEIWDSFVSVTDGTATGTASSTFEINSLTALDVSPALLDYGSVPAGTDTGALNGTTTLANTGNVDMDPQLSGLQLESGSDTIPVGNQEYSAGPFTWSAGIDLTGALTTLDITLPQRTAGAITDDISWGIGVPGGTPNGTYTGTSTFTAIPGV